MKKMNYTAVGLLIFGILMNCGCVNYQKLPSGDDNSPKTLSEAQQREYQYALTEATKQKVFGNLPQAAALYKKCIEVNPNSDVAYYQLGILYMRSGNNSQAIRQTLKAIDINDKNFWYYIQLATLYQIVQKRDSAIIVLERINQLWPENSMIKFDLAINYADEGRKDEALKILNAIQVENGISEKVSLLKEQIYVNDEDIESAINEVNKLLEISPDEIKYLGILAELYGAAKMNEKAMECYNRIFELEPQNGLAQLSIADYYRGNGDVQKYFGMLNDAFNNERIVLDKKLEVLVTIITDQKLLMDNTENVEVLIKKILNKYSDETRIMTIYGDFMVKTGRFEEAITQFEKVLQINKTNYFVWEQLLFLYVNKQNNEKIYEECLEALKLFPDRPLLYLFKGNVESIRKEYEISIITFEKGLNFTGDNNDLKLQFYSFLAEAYRNNGEYNKSDEYFERALEIDPENILLLNNYSYYLALRNERLSEAEEMSRKTITKEPQNYTYIDTYAWVLYKMGKYKKALEYIEQAIKYGGKEDPDIMEHYGDILISLGRQMEAVECWKLAIKLGGSEDGLKEKISKEK